MASIRDVLQELERVEQSVANLYGWLSEVFAADPETSRFFAAMRTQELSHSDLVRFERRLVRGEPKSFAEVEVDLDVLRAFVAEVRAFPNEHPDPGLHEALLFAMHLEEHAAEHLHRRAIVEANPEVEKLVSGLASADREHFLTLRRFIQDHSHLFGGA